MLTELAQHTEKLYYFYEIANEGSLQATARKLGISAPTLSYTVKQLELITGTKLFHRSQKGIRLTEPGEKLMDFCQRYYRDLEEVSRKLLQPKETTPVKIKVGTFQSIAIYFWPLLLESLKENKNLSLSMMTNRSKFVLEALMKKNIDIAITVESFDHRNLIRHDLYQDDYAFYCATNQQKRKFNRNDLLNHNLLYIPGAYDGRGKTLQRYINSWGLVFRDEFELDSLEVIGEFIKKGYGIGILPTLVAKSIGPKIRQIRIEDVDEKTFGTHRFFMSYRDDLEISQKLMNTFLDSAKKAVAQVHN